MRYELDLYHHGIKGQKWGVRRFQNPDGTLTAAGEKRYYGAANRTQKDIDSFKGYEKGVYSKKGKTLLSQDEVRGIVRELKSIRDKERAKGDAKREKDLSRQERFNRMKETGGKLAAKAVEMAKEKTKEAIKEAKQSDDAREKLRERLDDLSWNDKISSAQRERMEKELDDMSDDEVRALRKEINRQQASERAKEYLKDYQFKSTKDVMDSDTSDGERSAKRIIDDFEDSISNSSDFKFDTSYKSWFDDDDD